MELQISHSTETSDAEIMTNEKTLIE